VRAKPHQLAFKYLRRFRVASVVAAATAFATLAVSLPASGAPPSVAEKQRQADAIMAQLNALDSDLNRAVESYNGARLHLAQTETAIKLNTSALRIAKHNLVRARGNVAQRVVALYTGDRESTSTVEVILGARSLDDVLSRLDAANSVTAQDARIVREATTFRSEVAARQQRLARDRARASRLVAETGARRNQIESNISTRQTLLSSVKGEIARMQAAERQRQLQVAAQVRARLAEQAKVQAAAQAQTAATPAPGTTDPSVPASPAGTTTDTSGATSDPTTAAPAAAPPSRYGGAVGIAMKYLGVPYKWGGASPSTGFDCSGFTMYVYAQLGVSLPHYTGDQWQMGSAVDRGDLQPGDLLFFDGLGHEGMYIGNNQFIHAPHTGDVVKISSLSGWYAQTYMGARRL
jgi:cell wall-associated NlpC family hydrolase